MSSGEHGTITKQCVICGADCDGQPRVKDGRGRYYHRQCHQEAAERQARRREAASSSDAADSPLIEVFDRETAGGIDGDGGGGDWLDALPQTQPCPGCGRPLAAGAMLCTSCGHQMGGGTLKTRKGSAKRSSNMPSLSGQGWLPWLAVPSILGLLTLVLAIAGAEGGVSGAFLTLSLMGLVAGIWTLVAGWQRSPLICLGIIVGNIFVLGIPGLVFALFFQEDSRLKGLMGGVLIGMLLGGIGVGILSATGVMDDSATPWMP